LAAQALTNATQNADKGRLEHSSDAERRSGNYGQNLALWSGIAPANPFVYADGQWAEEAVNYDCKTGTQKEGSEGKVIGHFTQQVWAGTTKVGCAQVQKGGATFVTCDYSPPGNFLGQNLNFVSCRK
jgi:pathogenesis-related protein 1